MTGMVQIFAGYRVILIDGHWKPFATMPGFVRQQYAPRNWFTWKPRPDNEVVRCRGTLTMTTRAWHQLKANL